MPKSGEQPQVHGIADNPASLSLANPYPGLEETWYEDERECGWTLGPLDVIPDLRPAVEIAERFHPSAGPTIDDADREQVRRQLRSGLTTGQVYAAMGDKRVYWLTVIEEEARLENELASYPATPGSVAALRDERQLRWERIAARFRRCPASRGGARPLRPSAWNGRFLTLLHRPWSPFPRNGAVADPQLSRTAGARGCCGRLRILTALAEVLASHLRSWSQPRPHGGRWPVRQLQRQVFDHRYDCVRRLHPFDERVRSQ